MLRTLAPRLPGRTPAVADKLSCKEHSEQEWEVHKALIEKLYIGDNRKLTETMAILESKHGFAATEQMYKKRLRKWNIRKRSYRKAVDGSGASTPAPSLDASDVEDTDVEQVPRRRVPAAGRAQVAVSRTARIEPYAGLELVLDSVAAWSLSKLHSRGIQSDPMSRYLASPNRPPIQDSRTMYRTFELVFDLWFYGKGQLAGMAARKAFYALEFVLTEDHPDLVWHILDAIYDMVDRGHIQLHAMFLAHANALATRLLAANHPLLKILQQLTKFDHRTEQGQRQICHLLRQAWLRNVHILGQHIGSLAPQRLWLYEQLIWDGRARLRQGSALAQRREVITPALHELSQQQAPATGAGEYEKLRIDALVLEYTQMDLGDLQRAEELATDLLMRTASDAGARSNARFHAYARKMLARLQQEKRDWARAEENFRWAITKREAAHGAESSLRVIRDMWVLAAHFQKAGRQDAAAQIAEDATARAERHLQAGLAEAMSTARDHDGQE
ncbi:clr5 domain-containing protein [Hirsutella rhossiliensis]|uniref:Clr5 domain-containing protein n=1 Tax=Hirsutella rhossiliensis TaxID=111463 RepID=A0A9P8N5U4_9HYPO|nr:clr5 domain-containing protein [Hirsutella rhossiliensis]KAH0967314.1 clr5 domain-containing protein [Hirsutella rhossiliensis]